MMAAATFGHVPADLRASWSNDQRAFRMMKKRAFATLYAEGKASRAELMAAEMASYHGPGTCTFYGTANTNQMLMEFMGLHLAGRKLSSTPNTPLRDAL